MNTAVHHSDPYTAHPLSEEEAFAIADIYYPANPDGIGAPTSSRPDGKTTGHISADAFYLDPLGRGVWMVVGRAHWRPVRAR